MKAVFVELPAFERYRSDYLDDHAFLALQNLLMKRPEAGDSSAMRVRVNFFSLSQDFLVAALPD
jgi:hypothetical protein